MILMLLPITFGIAVYLFRTGRVGRKVFVCGMIAASFASVLVFGEWREGESRRVSSISAEEGHSGGGTVPLTVRVSDEEPERIDLRLPEKEAGKNPPYVTFDCKGKDDIR